MAEERPPVEAPIDVLADVLPPLRVTLTIKRPVECPEAEGEEVEARHPLWDEIAGVERYSPRRYYHLALEKPVTESRAVLPARRALIEAVELLALVWPFAGGGLLPLEEKQVITKPLYEINDREVREKLAARQGRPFVSVSFPFESGWEGAPMPPPLELACLLARGVRDDPALTKPLRYLRLARLALEMPLGSEAAWYTHLYKVRDGLKGYYGGKEAEARRALGILRRDWSRFGDLHNNNDLRHADLTGEASPLSPEDVNWLFRIAESWLETLLRQRDLPVYAKPE